MKNKTFEDFVEEMLSTKNVKDKEQYADGITYNGEINYGIYLTSRPNSILRKIEDSIIKRYNINKEVEEDYKQEIREVFFRSLKNFIRRHGSPNNEKEEKEMFLYLNKKCIHHINEKIKYAHWSGLFKKTYPIENIDVNYEGDVSFLIWLEERRLYKGEFLYKV